MAPSDIAAAFASALHRWSAALLLVLLSDGSLLAQPACSETGDDRLSCLEDRIDALEEQNKLLIDRLGELLRRYTEQDKKATESAAALKTLIEDVRTRIRVITSFYPNTCSVGETLLAAYCPAAEGQPAAQSIWYRGGDPGPITVLCSGENGFNYKTVLVCMR